MKSFLDFVHADSSPSGKTERWWVNSKTGDPLGSINWYAPWRRYVFYPTHNTLFDVACLTAIAQFIEQQMTARKATA